MKLKLSLESDEYEFDPDAMWVELERGESVRLVTGGIKNKCTEADGYITIVLHWD